MPRLRHLLAALLLAAAAGCAALDDDPIMGKKPFEPGTAFTPPGSTK
jgi:hypothetical protein